MESLKDTILEPEKLVFNSIFNSN